MSTAYSYIGDLSSRCLVNPVHWSCALVIGPLTLTGLSRVQAPLAGACCNREPRSVRLGATSDSSPLSQQVVLNIVAGMPLVWFGPIADSSRYFVVTLA